MLEEVVKGETDSTGAAWGEADCLQAGDKKTLATSPAPAFT